MILNALQIAQAATETVPADLASTTERNAALLLAFKERLFHAGAGCSRYVLVGADNRKRTMNLGFGLRMAPGGWQNWIVEITPDSYDTREQHVTVGSWRLLQRGRDLILARYKSNTYQDAAPPLSSARDYDMRNIADETAFKVLIANKVYKEILRLREDAGYTDNVNRKLDFSYHGGNRP